MNLNPTAVVFWGLLACIGYLVSGGVGAVVGLAIGLGISFLADILS